MITDYIDILISDIEMPRLDGYTLTKYVKDDPELNNLPIILFSSLITDELRHRGDSVGADDQISKPEFIMLAQRAINLIEKRTLLTYAQCGTNSGETVRTALCCPFLCSGEKENRWKNP